jgi:HEAT repeat protein
MSGQVSVNGAVEVLLDRGTGYSPRWTVGSGFLIGGTWVLTAAHNVGEGELSVRVRRGTEYTSTIAQVGDVDQGLDLAIVNITDPSFRDVPDAMVQFAKLNRESPDLLQGCWAIGFPRFKEKDLAPSGRSRLRDTAQVNGEIPLAANLISDMLELRVTATPQASPSLGSSEWEGMSGAVVFCKDPVHGDRAIGVIVEHYQPEGASSLTVVPITAINKLDEPTARKWWNLLGVVDQQGLPHLPPEPHIELVSAERIYRQQVINKYQSLDFSGFARSDLSLDNVPLEEVFVRLTLTVEKKVIQEPGRGESRQRERVITVQEPVELGQALSNHLLLVGEPGAGKSTLLRWLVVTFAEARQREPNRLGPSADADRLPVLVELGHLPDRYVKPEGGETPNWIQFLPEYLPTQIAFTNTPPQLLTRALADGRCLLLFDGLDEVADRQVRARMARSLADLARLFPGNRVIIGSRPAGVSESEGALRPLFQRCQIQRFTPEDVQRFFRFWYALDSELTAEQRRDEADALFARVQATPAILQLATTPLLSTILVLIWRKQGDLPERRVALYERCCRELIEQWEASHDVAYQGVLAEMDWEDHLHLLTFLAYTIHSQEQRTSATREELARRLAEALQAEGRYNEQDAAVRAAKQFLDTLGLRSGLLQYIGDDRYGFPHLTFQEYLAARYIAAQPDPDYIDLVMAHLHEVWWREVHLLTIAYLGSGSKERAEKASNLILKILSLYAPPSRILRSSRSFLLRPIGPGKFLPQVQLERRIAWMLAREFELAARGYAECVPDGTITRVDTALSDQAASLVRYLIYDEDRFDEGQETLLPVIGLLLQRQGNEVVTQTLLEALHHADENVGERAARILGRVGASNEAVMHTLLEALRDASYVVREHAAAGLGQVGGGNETVVRALQEALLDAARPVRRRAAASLAQMGVGNEAVVRTLLEALNQPVWFVQMRATRKSLAQMGVGMPAWETQNQALRLARETQDRTLLALNQPDWPVRERAAASLGHVGAGNEAVMRALLEAALHDIDERVRERAAASLGQVGVGNEVVMQTLLEATLHDMDERVRERAAGVLGQVGVDNEAVVRALLEALHHADKNVGERAAGVLGRVGVGNEVVIQTLLEALRDADEFVRERAARILGQVGVGNETVVQALLEAALHDAAPLVQKYAAASLGQMGVDNRAVMQTLLEALHDANYVVQEYAAASLGRVGVGSDAVVRALLEAALHGHPLVRRYATASLGQVGVGSDAVVRALLEVLHHADWFVRRDAAENLGHLEIKDTIQLHQVLVALNRSLHDNDVRQVALVSIRKLLDGRAIPGYRWEPRRKR